MFASPKRLRELGILGLNQRNADYIMRYNKRSRYPLVDDKIITKKLAQEAGIAVPALYGVIETERQIRDFSKLVENYDQFVIKPAQGAGGDGIVVVTGRSGDYFRKANGELMTLDYLTHYLSNILSGMHSLGGLPDCAMIEYMVQFDPVFNELSYQGVPDVRVIVFQGIPVAAMIRLPTRLSDGKANLHQGAIGVGIDLKTGITGLGVTQNRVQNFHPDTMSDTRGLTIPHWQHIMELSAQCADIVQLGYLGVDIVLDKQLGPLVLELNARPGLNVQLANDRGLLLNLRHVEKLKSLPVSVQDRVEYAQTHLAAAAD
jgi:alpha-L-glutamate ligase-like protein